MATRKPTVPPNPRSGDRRGRPLNTRPTSTIWYGMALLMVLLLAQAYWFVPTLKQIPYSEFKSLVKSGAVAEVVVGDQVIRGTLKEPASGDAKASNKFATTRVEDPKLAEELEAQGVKYAGELVNRWLPDLLSWLLPLIFIVAIWGFF